jgi:multisubunit Na+/H+ antiporter MnhG subunit
MRWSDIPFNPSHTTLRQFAGLCLIVFGGMALWESVGKGRVELALLCGFAAVMIGAIGLARPDLIRWVYVCWMVLAFPIGWTISQALMVLLFYGLFTPVGLIFKMIGRDPLYRARRPASKSYWTPKPMPHDVRRYFKQF